MNSLLLGLGLHVVSTTILFFGLVSALIWLARFASREILVKVTVWALVLGVLGSLVTIPWSMMQRGGHMTRWVDSVESNADDNGNSMQEMMDDVWNKDATDEEPAAQ